MMLTDEVYCIEIWNKNKTYEITWGLQMLFSLSHINSFLLLQSSGSRIIFILLLVNSTHIYMYTLLYWHKLQENQTVLIYWISPLAPKWEHRVERVEEQSCLVHGGQEAQQKEEYRRGRDCGLDKVPKKTSVCPTQTWWDVRFSHLLMLH